VLTSVEISPSIDTILVNENTTFVGQAKDQYGNNFTESLNWSASGGGTVSGGVYTSTGSAGTYKVYAAASSNAGIKDSATVVVLAEYPAPVAQDAELSTSVNTPVSLSLPFQCASQGPFDFTITKQPDHGSLNAVGNDVEYTPSNSYTGTDTYKWKVTDQSNSKESNEATVTITITDKLVVTLEQYYGSGTAPTIIEDGFINGADQCNDRPGPPTYTNIPTDLSGLTYLLTARDDKSNALGENEVMYRVNVSAPCTVLVFVQANLTAPSWIAGDGWVDAGQTVTASGIVHDVYKLYSPAGDIDLKRHKSGSCQGTGYAFKPVAGLPVKCGKKLGMIDKSRLYAYPNPFNPITNFNISIPVNDRIRFTVVDSRGTVVWKGIDKNMVSGNYSFQWNSGDLNSGIYFARLQAGREVVSRKLLVIK
jgi:hypothetical protein